MTTGNKQNESRQAVNRQTTTRQTATMQTVTRQPTRQYTRPSLDIDDDTPNPCRIKIVFHCGCGYAVESLVSAVNHCKENGHSLTVSGIVECIRKVPKSKAPVVIPDAEGIASNYDKMREMLSRIH